ncbi:MULTISPECIES: hypothetical protein [unclassified Cupriavidus]|uniref:hypothetical protein n=1 Tax=unclassified Cupriavidus TaxID=2640874 RepID=UPI001BFFE5F5|nr:MULTISPECIES: hypothetical protein [unclassified Cupriavidus]MCA3187537.1 hypothetical protein [Cupriavidus sp.]MCA3191164.1 hypothetical protein [Cupriavidus sp.]MCA3200228.1 hypothetical protein [Cupriavidus sp.]MCA3205429.1 hypothetical protein [Cupriavidus sp.]MCA3208272.1 hypothetical protein [Cupriavidus sp.]
MSAEALSNLSTNSPDSASREDDIREAGDGALSADALAAAEGTSRRKGTSGRSDKADKAEKHTPMMLQCV